MLVCGKLKTLADIISGHTGKKGNELFKMLFVLVVVKDYIFFLADTR